MATLPSNFGFNDLAGYEEGRRNEFAQSIQQQLAARRAALAKALTEQGQQLFSASNPAILEDLNSRGLLNSPTAVAQAQADALKQIGLSNNQYLNQFDDQATAAGLQSQQDALDTGLDLRRSQLESQMQQQQSAQEEAMARDLAKQQSRNNLFGSLLGVGGNLGSIYLGSKLLGAGGKSTVPGGLIPGGADGGGLPFGASGGVPFAGGAGAPSSSLFPGGLGQVGTATAPAGGGFFGSMGALPGIGALAASGYGASELAKAGEKKYGTLGGVLANPIGYQLNKAKQLISNPGKTVSSAVSGIGKSLSSVFCFDPLTLVVMEDGTEKEIQTIKLGDKTKGGIVQSIRASISEDGTLFERKGVIVTGCHAIKEKGTWIRVHDSKVAHPIEGPSMVLSLVTTEHRIYVKDKNGVEDTFGDEHETVQYEDLDLEQSLDRMNYDDNLVEVS